MQRIDWKEQIHHECVDYSAHRNHYDEVDHRTDDEECETLRGTPCFDQVFSESMHAGTDRVV